MKNYRIVLTILLCIGYIATIASIGDKSAKPDSIMVGVASYYHNKFIGRKTANGERFKQTKFTAACNHYPLGTKLRVTNLSNKKSIIVRINDRMGTKRRIIDLTTKGAKELGYYKKGLTKIKIELVDM